MVLLGPRALTGNGGIDKSLAHFDNAYSPRDAERSPSWREPTTSTASPHRNTMSGDASTDATTTPTLPTRHTPRARSQPGRRRAEGLDDTRRMLAEAFFRRLDDAASPPGEALRYSRPERTGATDPNQHFLRGQPP